MAPGAVRDEGVTNLYPEPGDPGEPPLRLGVEEVIHLVGLYGDALGPQPLQGRPEGPEGGHGVSWHFPWAQAMFRLPMFGEGKLLRSFISGGQVL